MNVRQLLGKMALAAVAVAVTASVASAQAIITNGEGVAVGIRATGAMGVTGTLPAQEGAPAATYLVGLSAVGLYGATPTWRDATTPGCLCEGFGFSANGIAGYDGNGTANLTIVDAGGTLSDSGTPANPFDDTYSTTVALTSLSGVTLTHVYRPSASPDLYEVEVTITNSTAATVTDVRYNRTMDWDVPPTEFSENVTLQGWASPGVPLGDLIDSCDDGFEAANPLSDCSPIFGGAEDTNFVDLGPGDIGARFTFGFGDLAAGASKTFKVFYGAAVGEAAAFAALAAAGAEGIYSFGQTATGEATGLPVTFIFAFGGVGAPPVTTGGVPEPASLLLLGGGFAAVLARRYRRK
jgi:hypothetical protein